MSKWSESFESTYETTGKLRKRTEEFRRHNQKEADRINKIMNRFKVKGTKWES